jgi:hypothetical protein
MRVGITHAALLLILCILYNYLIPTTWHAPKPEQYNHHQSDDETWLLCTDSFVPNRYQTAPHVANGYFGQSLPAEGAGYWIQQAENGTYAKNSK